MRDFSKELIVKTSVSTTVKGKNIFIPEDATNGDVIKAMFPNAKIEHPCGSILRFIVDGWSFQITEEWWNAKYKGVE